jgi:hypothetical protein
MTEETCKYVSSKGLANICDIRVFAQDEFDYMLMKLKENMVIYVHVSYIIQFVKNIDK